MWMAVRPREGALAAGTARAGIGNCAVNGDVAGLDLGSVGDLLGSSTTCLTGCGIT